MPPMRMPEKTSCPSVVTAGLTLAPRRQRHHGRWSRCEPFREDLLVAGLGPLSDADGGAQVLPGILRVIRPIEIGELDAAAVHQRAFRQVELERDLPQLVRLEG